MADSNSDSQGCRLDADGAHFRVWAPAAGRVVLVLEQPDSRRVPLRREARGFHSGDVAGVTAGARYRYELDGNGPFPDPCSRFQPEGPHGPSMVVDPQAHRWTDRDWPGVELQGQVIYELHVGTFTREGTFDAARAHLEHLADVGVTLIEVMPIAEFAGRWNWGYDGVALYAPFHGYGDYEAFKRFVDAAHAHRIGVILDVVYNHLGPDGAYHRAFSPHYFSDRYPKEWGDPLNFDGEHRGPVRQFAIDNAGYWIDEFHLDGLRLDATQSVFDASERHILAEISQRAREAAGGRSIVLVAENEPQDLRCLAPIAHGGFGLDAMWNDDYHHSARVALTGVREGYLHDYEGAPQEFVSAVRRGFLYQGQHYRWQRQGRGTRVTREPAAAFVHFLQNHDQVANTIRGERLGTTSSPALVRALTALTLLGPQTPMLFMGQELGATQPFPFFADHKAELAEGVRRGRRDFLAQFTSDASKEAQSGIPDPEDPRTFEVAKLDVERQRRDNPLRGLHRDLLRLRREHPLLAAQSRESIEGAVVGDNAFVLRWLGRSADLLLVVNLARETAISGAEPLLACERDRAWSVLWSSEHPDYGGSGVVSPIREDGWTLTATSAVLLRAGEESV